jgi:hypothetical protein
MKRISSLAAPLLVVLAATAACGGGGGDSSTGAASSSASGAGSGSAGVLAAAGCPSTLGIQLSWFPEAEYGGMYNIIGTNGKFDAKSGVYSGEVGGVKVEVRAGGPLTGNQQVTQQLYTDDSLFMGLLATDEAVQNSDKQPTKAVMNYFDKDPQILMYDPATYDFSTIADVGKTDATVLYFEGSTYMDYLVGSGQLKKSQVDGSYSGGSDRFITANGKAVQSGLVSAEPYRFENEYKQWDKPVKSLLVYDSGYVNYASELSMIPSKITKYADCLKAFVPMAQKASADYFAAPTAIGDKITEMNKQIADFWQTSPEMNAYAVKTLIADKIITNDASGTFGNFDPARMQKMIDILTPIFSAANKPVKSGLTPDDLYTNEFVDPTIGLKN